MAKAQNPELTLDKSEKYDVVVLMDIPSPTRFSSGFKDYIENAKNIIYIDHHPFRPEEWDNESVNNGVNMSKIASDNLAWIAERVPAAVQQAVVIASKFKSEIMNPLNSENIIKTLNSKSNPRLNASVASFTTGMSTDTGCFTRTANLLPKDIVDSNGNAVPVQKRPNFWPEGLSKWLFRITNGDIDKRWLRNEITYDLNDIKIKELGESARHKMAEVALKNKFRDDKLGVGVVTANYSEMKEILNIAQINEPETSLLDVQNAFKYSEVMGSLKDPLKNTPFEQGKSVKNSFVKNSQGQNPFDKDSIAVFVCESEHEGDLNTEGKKSLVNSLRYSFRSIEGSTHAELLASLFNGGGHGAAAGGSFSGKGVNINSKFSVIINGNRAVRNSQIYDALIKNYNIKHDHSILPEQQEKLCNKIELLQDEVSGKTSKDLIEDVVCEIRKNTEDV